MPVTLTVPTTKIKSQVIIRRASATPLTVHTPVVVIQGDVQHFDKNYVDLGATGPTVGDLLVSQDTLFDPVSHQQAGIEGGSCAITGVQNEFRTHCVGASPSPAGRSASGFGDRCSGQASCGRRCNRQNDQGASGTLTLVENGDGTRTGQDDGTGTLTIELRNGRS